MLEFLFIDIMVHDNWSTSFSTDTTVVSKAPDGKVIINKCLLNKLIHK